MELGYTITEKRSHKNSGKKSFLPHPYHIAVETVKIYKSKAVLDQVLKNINAIVENRPGIDACEIVAFSPPGDGGWNSPIGKTSDEKEYGTILEKGAEFIVPIIGGKVKAEKIADIFNSFDQKYAIGVSSRRNPINGDSTFEEVLSHDLLCHTPMIDFKCSSPEEAIHTIERRGIPILKSGVVLVDSGHSFHAHFPKAIQNRKESDNYLDNLVNNEEVCEKWVPLQKEQDYQLLRVSPCIRKPRMPIVLNL